MASQAASEQISTDESPLNARKLTVSLRVIQWLGPVRAPHLLRFQHVESEEVRNETLQTRALVPLEVALLTLRWFAPFA